MVKIGDKVKFRPAAYFGATAGLGSMLSEVVGTVVYINEKHGWYRVEYDTKYFGKQHECFPCVKGEMKDDQN